MAQSMGIDRMGASQVSRMCSSLDESVTDLQQRDLSDVSYPYIWLDAAYIKCRDAGRVQSTALVNAIGAGSGGYRRLLGLDAIDTEPMTVGGRSCCRCAHAGSTASSATPATPTRASGARYRRSSPAPRGSDTSCT